MRFPALRLVAEEAEVGAYHLLDGRIWWLCHPARSRFSSVAKDLPLNRPIPQAELHPSGQQSLLVIHLQKAPVTGYTQGFDRRYGRLFPQEISLNFRACVGAFQFLCNCLSEGF